MVEKPVVAVSPGLGAMSRGWDDPWPWAGIPDDLVPSPFQCSSPEPVGQLKRQRRRAPAGAAEEVRSLLARAVEAEVVPRLLLAHGVPTSASPDAVRAPAPAPEDVVALVALVITSDLGTTLAFIQSLRARGATLEGVYLELLAPAARRLGQLWHEDLCSFADVTMALGRLQRLLRELGPAFIPAPGMQDDRRRAALVTVPGEQHSFGVSIVAEFFVRAGWDVWSEPVATDAELAGVLHDHWFAVLGLSVGCDAQVPRLRDLIRSVRRASRNPAIAVMVGGRALVERPELAATVGADATATDGRQAALQAETLLALLSNRITG